MKTFIKILALFVTLFTISCTKENINTVEAKQQERVVPFALDDNKTALISVILRVEDGLPKFISDDLEEIQCIDERTGKKSYGFFLKKERTSDNSKLLTRSTGGSGIGGISRGYFFTGDCFEYGTFYEGDNGMNLFTGCTSCLMLDPICPEEGSGWA
jgi:hypothetical protein